MRNFVVVNVEMQQYIFSERVGGRATYVQKCLQPSIIAAIMWRVYRYKLIYITDKGLIIIVFNVNVW